MHEPRRHRRLSNHATGSGRWRAAVALTALLVACAAPPAPPQPTPPAGAPADFPHARYADAGGYQVFDIDAEASELVIKVYRSGVLRNLGHNHVIATHRVQGQLAVDEQSAHFKADAYVAATDLIVDEPERRQRLGSPFDSVRTPEDVAATRANMLGPAILDAAQYPFLMVTVEALTTAKSAEARRPAATDQGTAHATVTFRVKEMTLRRELALHWQRRANSLSARAGFTLRHEELGIRRFGAAGGVIGVAEPIDVEVLIVATPAAR